MTKIMRGATELRRYISEFLSDAIPPTVDVMRDQYELDEFQLPYPKKYDTIDPTIVSNDEYPAMGSVIINDRNHVRNDVDPYAQLVYSTVYTVRLVVVARTPDDGQGNWEKYGKEGAVRLRDDLTRCLHHVLLQTPSLGHPDFIKLNEGAMTTDYLEPFLANTQSKRWIAASLVNAEVAFTESTWLPAYGTANTIDIEERMLNP